MNHEFIFALFCLTVIALTAITHGRPEIAEHAVKAIVELANKTLNMLKPK
jgi:hypothetical protein